MGGFRSLLAFWIGGAASLIFTPAKGDVNVTDAAAFRLSVSDTSATVLTASDAAITELTIEDFTQ